MERVTFTVQRHSADAASWTHRQQSWLLQHSAGWDLWITLWSTPVGAECCCCSVGILFSARRSEHVTPLFHDLHWLKVAEKVPSLCTSGTPLSRWHHAVAPCQDAPTVYMSTHRHLLWSATMPTLVIPSTRRPTPSISCGYCMRLECSSFFAKSCSITNIIQLLTN